MTSAPDRREQAELAQVEALLARQRRVEHLVHRQGHEGQKQQIVEAMVRKQHLAELRAKLAAMPSPTIARILEALPPDDSVAVWELVAAERGEAILTDLSEALRESLRLPAPAAGADRPARINAFELRQGRLRQVPIRAGADFAACAPVWVDLLAPSAEERRWLNEGYGLRLADTGQPTDIEESARFYIDDEGTVHLRSDFLLGRERDSRNVPVAFALHRGILFSTRDEELPVFRAQRLRARIEPGLAADGTDLLLDLYAADIEYSAAALEGIYAQLEGIGHTVLSMRVGDDEAAGLLAAIARQEDLNGRIRRNVLDTRRALSFLLRSHLLSPAQAGDAQQILRDIDSLDGHTGFLFGKINFLLDATVGFISISQNRRVSRLAAISVVFVPINIVAGIGGMSEFSMMTQGIPWPLAYAALVGAMAALGAVTYRALRRHDGHRPPPSAQQP